MNRILVGRPSWDNAPNWAKYLAMDEDGTWSWFENEPFLLTDHWYCTGRSQCCNVSWYDSKEKRK